MDLDLEGICYRTFVVGHAGARTVACIAPLGAAIPAYPVRRRIRNLLGPLASGTTIVFTDSAHSAEVWSWIAGGDPEPPRYRERLVTAGYRIPGSHAAAASPARRRTVHGWEPEDDPSMLIPLAILRGARRGLSTRSETPEGESRASADPDDPRWAGHTLQAMIEDPAGPAGLRCVWRSLVRTRVLDPRCEAGEWLLDAMRVLEWIYAACIEQMGIWLGETRLARRRRRASHLRDFRHVLSRVEAGGLGATGFGREASLLLNLYGITARAAAAAECRRRLVAGIGAGSGALGRLPRRALNVRSGASSLGISSRGELVSALAGTPARGSTLHRLIEEAEAVAAADRFLRRARLEVGMDAAALEAGMRSVRSRARALSRELDSFCKRASDRHLHEAEAASDRVRSQPLHLLAEWHSVVTSRGFDLVRPVR